MEMQMHHALPRLLADVGDDPVALQPLLLGHLGNDLEHVGHHGAVIAVHLSHRVDMGLGDHQKMSRRLGSDVVERIADVVLVDLAAGDLPCRDLTE